MEEELLLYATSSLCPKCVLADKKGLSWKPAFVVERHGHIWLSCMCDAHGEHATHYCSNPSFFRKVLHFTDKPYEKSQDIEDLVKRKRVYSERQDNQPFVIELAVYRGTFLGDEDIRLEAKRLMSLAPKGKKVMLNCRVSSSTKKAHTLKCTKFLVKITAKLAKDMEMLNKKAHVVEQCFPSTPVLMEVSFERLVALSQLRDSIFLQAWVYPALKYFLRKGDESVCMGDLKRLFKYVRQFKGIRIVVTLAVNRPFPDLSEILAALRSKSGFVRCIVISHERPVDLITAQASEEALAKAKAQFTEDNITREHIAKKTKTTISAKSSHEETRQVVEQEMLIHWEFVVEERDIGFSIQFKPLDDVTKTQFREYKRYKSRDGKVSGDIEVKKPGIFYFKWDNTYSRIRKKSVHWAIALVAADGAEKQLSVPVDSLDPYDLLVSIEQATEKTISVKDFFPASGARVLEPFIANLGYGSYSIRVSPFCFFGTALVNMGSAESVPITRFLDFDIFYEKVGPLVDAWSADSLVKNIKFVAKLRKIVQQSALQPIPDLVSYLTDPKKADVTSDFINNIQMLLVHNNMDVSGVDLQRRCNCSVLSAQPKASQGLVASCTGCI